MKLLKMLVVLTFCCAPVVALAGCGSIEVDGLRMSVVHAALQSQIQDGDVTTDAGAGEAWLVADLKIDNADASLFQKRDSIVDGWHDRIVAEDDEGDPTSVSRLHYFSDVQDYEFADDVTEMVQVEIVVSSRSHSYVLRWLGGHTIEITPEPLEGES